jgi:hypothetical protein
MPQNLVCFLFVVNVSACNIDEQQGLNLLLLSLQESVWNSDGAAVDHNFIHCVVYLP